MNFWKAIARFRRSGVDGLGAEYHGTKKYARFQRAKWTTNNCTDFEYDTEYANTVGLMGAPRDPDVEEYVDMMLEQKTVCIDCLWNEGSYCTHDKAQTPEATAERAALGIY